MTATDSPNETRAAFDAMEAAVAAGNGSPPALFTASRAIRRTMEEALAGRKLTEGSLILERHRRLRHKLDHLDGHILNRDWEAIASHLPDFRVAFDDFVRDATGLAADVAPKRRPLPSFLVNVGPVARKEIVIVLQGMLGLVLFALFLVTFGIGLEAVIDGGVPGVSPSVETAWRYAHSLDFLSAPLAGLLLGYALINEERHAGTIHFLAAKPVTREGIVLGKWLGAAISLATIVGASAFIVGGTAYAVGGELGDGGVVIGYVIATYLVALAFMSVSLAASAIIDRGAAALGAAFGLYIVLGLVWQNAFYLRTLKDAGTLPSTGPVLLYLASPFTAWFNWTAELLGPRSELSGLPIGDAWHAPLVRMVESGVLDGLPFYATTGWYVFMLLAWCALGLGVAMLVFRRRDAA